MQELIPINILIGDRSYRIKTSPEDEEKIRLTVRTINEKIIEFKTRYSGKDTQDYIAMVLIWYATQSVNEPNPALEKEISAALQKIEEQLDKMK